MDMQDWIILRLMRTALKTNHKFSHTRDFVETAVYLSKKYGDHAIGQATQELLNEEREKEAQRKAALAKPPCACAHCQSEAQLRKARGWQSPAEVAASR